jgi:hypothetical protein
LSVLVVVATTACPGAQLTTTSSSSTTIPTAIAGAWQSECLPVSPTDDVVVAVDTDVKLKEAITELLGQRAVLSMLQLDGFARRVVATVDNLGRSHAAPRLWPVNPTPGRFTVAQESEGTLIATTNSARYLPFMSLVDTVDAARAVALYKRFYPLFQREYEALGFPRGYFNDRLVDVIDELLATPEPREPPAVRLTRTMPAR